MNLICFKHPGYSGNSAPVLSCNTCCKIFVDEIKAQNTRSTSDFKPAEWLRQKSKEARDAVPVAEPKAMAVNESNYNFRPETI